MKSALDIGYPDLIKACESRIAHMEKNYPRMKLEKRISPGLADHNLQCEKVLLKMLKQGVRGRQLDMYEAFEKVKQ